MPLVTIRIPTPLRNYTGGADEVRVEAGSVVDALNGLGTKHDGILAKILSPQGELRQFVNIFLGSKHLRGQEGLSTLTHEGDVISIVPAVAGGCRES